MSEVKQLWDIQELETAQFKVENLLKNNEYAGQLRKIKAEIQQGQLRFKEFKEEYSRLKIEIKQLEEAANLQNQKLSELNVKLYNGEMNNKKEIAGVQLNISKLKQQVSKLEDEELYLIEKQEQIKSTLVQISESLQQQKEMFYNIREQHQQQQRQLKDELLRLRTCKEEKYKKIKQETLDLFLNLKKKIKNPVAKVENSICCGCHVALSYNQIKELKADNLVKCDNCGRLIFIASE